jgi:LPS-assembly lipoprotein
LLGLALLLPACGFQPRGQAKLPPSVQSVYVSTADRYSPFYRELTTALRARGATLSDDSDKADAVIRITRDDTGQRVLAVSTRNVPTEYDVYYSIRYDIAVNGAIVFEPQTLTLNRDYTYDETEVLGKAREETVLREALAADLAGLVTRRLNALN